jgi:hypothetical protein
MKNPRPYGDSFTCPDCEKQTDIIVYPYIPAITSHCYDDNEPPDGGYCDPEECPECGCGIDYEDYCE